MPRKPRQETRRPPARVLMALIRPVQRFIQTESSSGIILIAAAVLAFALANSPWAASYFAFQEAPLRIALGGWSLEKALVLWINDFLMAIFFFLVGLEIKRELLVGELAGWDKASLPAAAALGGMVVPALIYTAFNYGQPTISGWGVPMATDIAFALGVLALMGDRVQLSLKVFLLALAIVDDLGAVLVIAVFYTHDLNLGALAIALGIWAVAILYGRVDGRRAPVFAVLGLVMWYFMLKSGVHATVAGVLLAFAVPARRRMSLEELRRELQWTPTGHFEDIEARIHHIEDALDRAHSPLHRMEHQLVPYVAFLIMPLFAFANAGVSLAGSSLGQLVNAVSIGVFLGLLLGKPIGVAGFVWLAVRTGMTRLPDGISWAGITGVGLLAGIGFTMSIFIANLAFSDAVNLDNAKIGVLAASLVAALGGLAFLHAALPRRARPAPATPVRSAAD